MTEDKVLVNMDSLPFEEKSNIEEFVKEVDEINKKDYYICNGKKIPLNSIEEVMGFVQEIDKIVQLEEQKRESKLQLFPND